MPETAAGRALALAGVEREVAGLPAPAPWRTRTRRKGGGCDRTPRSRLPGLTARSARLARRQSGQPAVCPAGPGGGRGSAPAEPARRARAAGMRLSSTRAVLPAPDGPATAVSRFTGNSAVRSCRLYRSAISMAICPSSACTLGSVAGNAGRAGQERADDRARVGFQLTGGARGDHVAALCAGSGAEFDDPVGGSDELPLVLDHDHRIAVPGERGDHLAQPGDVAGVQSDRRLVQHVEHAGGAGPDG